MNTCIMTYDTFYELLAAAALDDALGNTEGMEEMLWSATEFDDDGATVRTNRPANQVEPLPAHPTIQ